MGQYPQLGQSEAGAKTSSMSLTCMAETKMLDLSYTACPIPLAASNWVMNQLQTMKDTATAGSTSMPQHFYIFYLTRFT